MRTLEEIVKFDDHLLEIEYDESEKYRYYKGSSYHEEYPFFFGYLRQINAIRMHDFILASIEPREEKKLSDATMQDYKDFIKRAEQGPIKGLRESIKKGRE
ncbi:MAG: hypothetical protein WC389_15520 [Lutibacter sp.]|jgi:hypothetical protein